MKMGDAPPGAWFTSALALIIAVCSEADAILPETSAALLASPPRAAALAAGVSGAYTGFISVYNDFKEGEYSKGYRITKAWQQRMNLLQHV